MPLFYLPTTFNQRIVHVEDGFGETSLTIKISEDYNEIFGYWGHNINCIDLDQSDEQLEDDSGEFAQSELSFSINEAAIDAEYYHDTSVMQTNYVSGFTVAGLDVDGITNASECVVTVTGHNFYTGKKVSFTGDSGDVYWNKAFRNRTFIVSDVSGNTFKLKITPVTFLRDALSSDNKRYIGVFFNVPENVSPSIEDAAFTGIVSSQEDSEDLLWRGGEWVGEQNPLSSYKYKAQNFHERISDDYKLHDLIHGSNEEFEIPGIDTTWESNNVFDGDGWFVDQSRSIKVHKLVSLNAILRKLADNFCTAILNQTGITFSVIFDRCLLDGKFFPARWNHPDKDGHEPRYCLTIPLGSNIRNDMTIYDDDGQSLAIDPDGTPTQYETPYINYAMIKAQIKEYDPAQAKQFMWENNESCDTFIKLLYAIADAFKIYLTVSYDNPTTLRVSYTTRSAIKTNRVYLRDGASSKTIRKATNVDSTNQKQGGMAFYLADDGPITYTKSQKYDKSFMISTPSFVDLRGRTKNDSTAKRPILTISPTTALVEPGNDDDLDYVQAVIPHNHYFTFDGNPQDGYHYQETKSIHTAIYLYVKKHTIANGYAADHLGSNREHNYYYTPAAAYSINIDDVEKTFERLTDYANSLLIRDGDYYQASKEIDVPYWNGFSLNSDGSARGWNKVNLRAEVIIDNISYLVRKISRKFSEIKTTLSLDAITRFDGVVDAVAPIIPSIPEIPLSDTYIPDSTAVISDYTAHGSVKAFQYVSWYDVGKVVEFTYPKESHYSRLAGFALNDADDGETVNVQTAGKLIIPGLSGPIGASLYLSDETPNENVSQQWMIQRTTTANLWAEIARIIDNETIEVKLFDEYIFE